MSSSREASSGVPDGNLETPEIHPLFLDDPAQLQTLIARNSTTDPAELYELVKRKPSEGTASEAIKCHAQACGYVAYWLDIHPDQVAREVAVGTARSEAVADPKPDREIGLEERVEALAREWERSGRVFPPQIAELRAILKEDS